MQYKYSTDSNNYQLNLSYDWLFDCRPANHCQLGYEKCRHCFSKWCVKHGQANRIDMAEQVEYEHTTIPAYAVTLNFNTPLPARLVSKARAYWLKELKQIYDFEYLWVIHFLDGIAHLHATILVYEVSFPIVNTLVWRNALKHINHPDSQSVRTGCDELKDWFAWHYYIYQCDRVLLASECPPWYKTGKKKGKGLTTARWIHSRRSKGYPHSVTPQRL